MKSTPEAARLALQIRSRVATLPVANTPALRRVRRDVSRQLRNQPASIVLETALLLLSDDIGSLRFLAYELVSRHKLTFENLAMEDFLNLGRNLDCWSAVDCFALYLSGPAWRMGRIPDRAILAWAKSEDRWWRRAALVSTVPLSRRGSPDDVVRVARICALLAADRDDMVVKALSWALREMVKKHPSTAKAFLAEHRQSLASRILREVSNKLTTGLKTPRRSGMGA